AHQGRHDLPRGNCHGEIPWRYQPGHSNWLARADCRLVRELSLGGEPMEAAAFSSNEIGHVDSFLNVAACFLEHLAHFASHIASELFLALYKNLADLEQYFSPPRGWRFAPGRQSLGCSLNSTVDIFRGRSREPADQLSGVTRAAIVNILSG